MCGDSFTECIWTDIHLKTKINCKYWSVQRGSFAWPWKHQWGRDKLQADLFSLCWHLRPYLSHRIDHNKSVTRSQQDWSIKNVIIHTSSRKATVWKNRRHLHPISEQYIFFRVTGIKWEMKSGIHLCRMCILTIISTKTAKKKKKLRKHHSLVLIDHCHWCFHLTINVCVC